MKHYAQYDNNGDIHTVMSSPRAIECDFAVEIDSLDESYLEKNYDKETKKFKLKEVKEEEEC